MKFHRGHGRKNIDVYIYFIKMCCNNQLFKGFHCVSDYINVKEAFNKYKKIIIDSKLEKMFSYEDSEEYIKINHVNGNSITIEKPINQYGFKTID